MKKFFYVLPLVGFVLSLTGLFDGLSGAEPKLLFSPPSGEKPKQLSQVKNKGAQGYDPTKDPGSSGQGKSVDYEKLKGLMEKFDGGLRQKGKNQKPAEAPAPVPIPKEYTSPGEPSESKDAPQFIGSQPLSNPGSSDLSSPALPEKEKAILQKYAK